MENMVILVGNLGGDPETRVTNSGTTVASLSVATTHRRKVGEQWESQTEWHRVSVFGRTADNCGKYLRKGRQVYVKGRLSTRKWEDRDGNKRSTTEVIADVVKFLGKGDQAWDNRAEPRAGYSDTPGESYPDDDIPF